MKRIGLKSLEDLIELTRYRKLAAFNIFDLDLSIARDNVRLDVAGGLLQIIDETNQDLYANIDVQFGIANKYTTLNLKLGERIVTPFETIIISNDAQAGKIFTLMIAPEVQNIANYDTIRGTKKVDLRKPNEFYDHDSQAAAQTNTVIRAAPGAGLRFYITDFILSNGATAGTIRLVESTAAPVDLIPPLYFAINTGACKHLHTPIQLSVNANLGYTSVGVTSHSVFVTGYVAP